MKLKSVLTTRHIQSPFFWQIVWEWEDAMAKTLGLPLVNRQSHLLGNQATRLDRVLFRHYLFRYTQLLLGHQDLPALCFHMNPPHVRGYFTRRDAVPIVIDCWRSELERIPAMFNRHKAIFICSLEAVNLIKSAAPLLPVHYLPISIPESYIPTAIPEKDIDILCYGRTHPDLVEWGLRFSREHPGVRFCRTGLHEGRPVLYENDRKSEMDDSRDALLALLGRSKIVLQSSPGMHTQEYERTGGLNVVTPRFFEAAAHCCHMVGIYPRNEEYERLRIADVCSRVFSYAEFKECVAQLLQTRVGNHELFHFQKFIKENTTERRALEIQQVLAAA